MISENEFYPDRMKVTLIEQYLYETEHWKLFQN